MQDAPRVDQPGLHGILKILRRRWLAIAACFVVVPAVALALALAQTKQYSASASLLFRTLDLNAGTSQTSPLPPSPDPVREASTNLTLASLRPVAARTAARVRRGLTIDAVAREVQVSSDGSSDVARVTATDPNPVTAATLANTYAAEYIAFRRASDQATLRQPIQALQRLVAGFTPAERSSARGQALKQRLDDLQSLFDVQTGNAELVQQAPVPTTPSSPRPVRDGVIGAILGLLLGLAVAFLVDLLDRRVRDARELEELFGLPVFGTIAESRSLRARKRNAPQPSAADLEAFRMVYANLRYIDVDEPARSVMITSAGAGEGKTTLAWNLAAVAAADGVRVLLIGADLRHPKDESPLAADRRGLSLVLTGQKLSDNMLDAADIGGGSLPPTLSVLPAGPRPPSPARLLTSARMRSLLEAAEREYDLVVIDTPPLVAVADAVPIVKLVDGVIVVARLGRTTRDGVTALRRQFAKLGARVVGLVINGAAAPASGYYEYSEEREPAPGIDWSALEPAVGSAGADQARQVRTGAVEQGAGDEPARSEPRPIEAGTLTASARPPAAPRSVEGKANGPSTAVGKRNGGGARWLARRLRAR